MISVPFAARWATAYPLGRTRTAIAAKELRLYLGTHLKIKFLKEKKDEKKGKPNHNGLVVFPLQP
jgi:hypothetical protein